MGKDLKVHMLDMKNPDSIMEVRKDMAKQLGVSEEDAGIQFTQDQENFKRVTTESLKYIQFESLKHTNLMQFLPTMGWEIFRNCFEMYIKVTKTLLPKESKIELIDKIQIEILKFLDEVREDLKKGDE